MYLVRIYVSNRGVLMMKLSVYLLSALLLVGCGESQSVDIENEAISLAQIQSKADKQAALSAVNDFYRAISEKNCERAVLIRPKYTVERCEKLSNIVIKTVRQEYNDGMYSVMYLNVAFSIGDNRQDFNGYLWLMKDNESWKMQENFSSVDSITYDQFIKAYIPQPQDQAVEVKPLKTIKDVIDEGNPVETLSSLRGNYSKFAKGKIILVDVSKQQLSFYDGDNTLIKRYPVSTATKGVGNQSGSEQTPLGSHAISDRIGANADYASIFISRVNTGKIAKIINQAVDSPSDLVTSRILWLDGLELGKNKGGAVDSHKRYIYIHGTQEEGLIGKPASHGCIRMKNADVIELFDQVAEDTLVYIGT